MNALGKGLLPHSTPLNLIVIELKNSQEASSNLQSQLPVLGFTDANKNLRFINKRMKRGEGSLKGLFPIRWRFLILSIFIHL